MLSPEMKKLAEENLTRVNKEIADFKPAAFGHQGEVYLDHFKEHQGLWMKFLGR